MEQYFYQDILLHARKIIYEYFFQEILNSEIIFKKIIQDQDEKIFELFKKKLEPEEKNILHDKIRCRFDFEKKYTFNGDTSNFFRYISKIKYFDSERREITIIFSNYFDTAGLTPTQRMNWYKGLLEELKEQREQMEFYIEKIDECILNGKYTIEEIKNFFFGRIC